MHCKLSTVAAEQTRCALLFAIDELYSRYTPHSLQLHFTNKQDSSLIINRNGSKERLPRQTQGRKIFPIHSSLDSQFIILGRLWNNKLLKATRPIVFTQSVCKVGNGNGGVPRPTTKKDRTGVGEGREVTARDSRVGEGLDGDRQSACQSIDQIITVIGFKYQQLSNYKGDHFCCQIFMKILESRYKDKYIYNLRTSGFVWFEI